MYEVILKSLGLAKNEARIYETLLLEGESSVGTIAQKSKVHRRNVYDSLQRLMEKGLVFEILQGKENIYQAVDPNKLSEILSEKQRALDKVLIDMEELYRTKPALESVYIYRGLDGWKNYMRDMLRIGEDVYTIGAQGAWGDKKIASFVTQFAKETAEKKMRFKMLVNHSAVARIGAVGDMLSAEYRVLPAAFNTASTIDVFGDRVVIIADCTDGVLRDDLSITVIVNKKIANSFRTWFELLWSTATKS